MEKKQQCGQDILRSLLSKRTSIDVSSYETPSVYLDMDQIVHKTLNSTILSIEF
ncbi:unnamed protein product [Paramecium octaurelia]|uniref:Uncharacterized protein n=1 Tax=Paramecium octaurelia TaxID=43137 RepID=A0A8S1V4Q4_PAROT|nr:unnamed protein product [Paramecium octaurelia]